jgi:hypothetical protein
MVAAESCESLNHKNPDSDKGDDLEYAPSFGYRGIAGKSAGARQKIQYIFEKIWYIFGKIQYIFGKIYCIFSLCHHERFKSRREHVLESTRDILFRLLSMGFAASPEKSRARG